jgi:hypothetical protein
MLNTSALMALYHAAGGPGWRDRTGWGSADPCHPVGWYGVTCRAGRPVAL